MPNGNFAGSDSDWKRLEAPLRSVDWQLRLFALRHMLPLSKNGRGGHEWPERSFRWGKPVSRLIQIYLKDASTLAHNLWICASEDRDGVRYWKEALLREDVSIESVAHELPALLAAALRTTRGWSSTDLVASPTCRGRTPGGSLNAALQADVVPEPQRGAPMIRPVRVLLLILAYLATQVAAWPLCVVAIYLLNVYQSTATVTDPVPGTFPVVVVWKDPQAASSTAAVLYHPSLPAFRAGYPESTFLVPEADETRLRQLVRQRSIDGGTRATFQVDRRANDVQVIRVVAFEGPDFSNTAWYEAHADRIVPLRQRRYFGPSLGLAAVLAGTPLSILVNAAAWIIPWWWRRRRSRACSQEPLGLGRP